MWINFRKYKKRKLLIMAKVYDDINVKYRHKNYLPRFGFRFSRDTQLLWNTIMSMEFRRDTNPKQIYAYSIAVLNTYPIITSYLLSNIFILIWYSWNTVFIWGMRTIEIVTCRWRPYLSKMISRMMRIPVKLWQTYTKQVRRLIL